MHLHRAVRLTEDKGHGRVLKKITKPELLRIVGLRLSPEKCTVQYYKFPEMRRPPDIPWMRPVRLTHQSVPQFRNRSEPRLFPDLVI